MNKKWKEFLTELVFWLHLPIVLVLFGLFFVPKSVWSGKVVFHFWFVITVLVVEFLWGLALYRYTHKIDIICPLTTLMQWLRGYPIDSPQNYGHSYIAELLSRIKVKVSYNTVNIILYITLGAVVLEYIFWR